jgi:hypothetical protein
VSVPAVLQDHLDDLPRRLSAHHGVIVTDDPKLQIIANNLVTSRSLQRFGRNLSDKAVFLHLYRMSGSGRLVASEYVPATLARHVGYIYLTRKALTLSLGYQRLTEARRYQIKQGFRHLVSLYDKSILSVRRQELAA